MTDLHTHILPGMDDGAKTLDEALSMLRAQAAQGVDTVVLTPHFYRSMETLEEFLARRENARSQLLAATEGRDYPKLLLGAEVAWTLGMIDLPGLEQLCYENTKMLLVELPITPWTDYIFRELYSLEVRHGIVPVIAHIDRYFTAQSKKNIERLLAMGYPMQVSASALYRFSTRNQALRLLEKYDGLLISDCHDSADRAPNMGDAMRIIVDKRGSAAAARIAAATDEILFT